MTKTKVINGAKQKKEEDENEVGGYCCCVLPLLVVAWLTMAAILAKFLLWLFS